MWLRWPSPLRRPPWQRERLRITTCAGLGDELMATTVLRAMKRHNPHIHLTYLTRRPELFADLPYIDVVERFTHDGARGAVYLAYSTQDDVPPPRRPLTSLMAERVGLRVRTTQLDRPRVQAHPEVRARVAAIGGPRVVVQPRASDWTPNKNWPLRRWVELVERLTERFSVIEVGTSACLPAADLGPRFHSLAGLTDVSDFAWVVSQAAVFVGPVSGGMHVANAFEIPSVIIFGGYEHPDGYGYARTEALYSPVACAPCWLRKPCPYGLECLERIQVADVFAAVVRAARSAP